MTGKATDYSNYLQKLLTRRRFLLAEELSKAVCKEFNVKPDNSRQIISRATKSGSISSTYPTFFTKRQPVYYTHLNFNIDTLLEISSKYNKPLFRLASIIAKHKLITLHEAKKISSTIEEGTRSNTSTMYDYLIILQKFNAGTPINVDGEQYLSIAHEHEIGTLLSSANTRALAERLLIPDILSWTANANLNKFQSTCFIRKDSTTSSINFCGVTFDAHSKANVSRQERNVLFDIKTTEEYEDKQLYGFIDRIQTVNSISQSLATPMIIFNEAQQRTLNIAKSAGLITLSLENLFGRKAKKAVQKIISLLTTQSTPEISDIESVLDEIEQNEIASLIGNLKGVLFEYILNPLFTNMFGNCSIQQNVKIKHAGNKYEYDYIIHCHHKNEIVVLETKGYNKDALISYGAEDKNATPNNFFSKRLPHLKSYYRSRLSDAKITGSYITSAMYESHCLDTLKDLNKGKLKPSGLDCFYDRTTLLAILKTHGFNNIIKIINKHF